jgi:hypothetical protein
VFLTPICQTQLSFMLFRQVLSHFFFLSRAAYTTIP